jgi:uncharacterized protein YjbI with pentapeptide repeats
MFTWEYEYQVGTVVFVASNKKQVLRDIGVGCLLMAYFLVASFWSIPKKQVLRAIGVGCLLVAFALFIFLGYHWDWTGFPQKKLFDWIQILVIPVAVAVGTFVLNRTAKKRDEAAERAQKDRDTAAQKAQEDRDTAAQKAQKDRDETISAQRTQDAALQTYLDRMSLMLVERPLLTARPGEPLSVVARALTLTILERLDGYRKRAVLEFLYEAGLINRDQPVIDLGDTYPRRADRATIWGVTLGPEPGFQSAQLQAATLARSHLRAAHLRGAALQGANLQEAHLQGANLQEAHLERADLRGANLEGADLRGAYLQRAQVTDKQLGDTLSLQGATMPDGSKHP